MSAGRTFDLAAGRWIHPDWVKHRAGGRRRYNAHRQALAQRRRYAVASTVARAGWPRGAQAAIAREMGVHRSTINRDLARYEAETGQVMRIQVNAPALLAALQASRPRSSLRWAVEGVPTP